MRPLKKIKVEYFAFSRINMGIFIILPTFGILYKKNVCIDIDLSFLFWGVGLTLTFQNNE